MTNKQTSAQERKARKAIEDDFRASLIIASGQAAILGLRDIAEYLAFLAVDDLTEDHSDYHSRK
jgi:hypothetical protein